MVELFFDYLFILALHLGLSNIGLKLHFTLSNNGFICHLIFAGTSRSSNPIAMDTIFKNTVFTNVASTSDGGVYWEGMEDEINRNVSITDWRGKAWLRGKSTGPAAHPNSR